MQDFQPAEVAQVSGYRLGELVVAEVQFCQKFRITQFRRYGLGKPVVVEVQQFQVGETAQRSGDGVAQHVVAEIQFGEAEQVAQLGRYHTENWLFSRRSSSRTDWSPSLPSSAGIGPSKSLS